MRGKSISSAILGVIGGSTAAAVIAFFTSSRIERQRFDYQIIQQALQADTQREREARLQFLVEAGFIQDANLKRRLMEKLEQKAKLPRLPAAGPPVVAPHSRPLSPRQVEPIVRNIIVEQLGVNPENVTLTARLVEDLGADSLDLVELCMAVDEEFEVEIPDEELRRMRTVADAVTYLTAHSKRVLK
jgi:acyl carrier protein